MTRGLQTNVLSFYGKKWLKKQNLGPFFQNFLGGMSPEPLYDWGLQITVFSFHDKKRL